MSSGKWWPSCLGLNVLMPNKQQAIAWANDVPVHQRVRLISPNMLSHGLVGPYGDMVLGQYLLR